MRTWYSAFELPDYCHCNWDSFSDCIVHSPHNLTGPPNTDRISIVAIIQDAELALDQEESGELVTLTSIVQNRSRELAVLNSSIDPDAIDWPSKLTVIFHTRPDHKERFSERLTNSGLAIPEIAL